MIAHQLADRGADCIDHELPIAQTRQVKVGREVGEQLLDLDMILITPEAELIEGLAQSAGPELGEQSLFAFEALARALGDRVLAADRD